MHFKPPPKPCNATLLFYMIKLRCPLLWLSIRHLMMCWCPSFNASFVCKYYDEEKKKVAKDIRSFLHVDSSCWCSYIMCTELHTVCSSCCFPKFIQNQRRFNVSNIIWTHFMTRQWPSEHLSLQLHIQCLSY